MPRALRVLNVVTALASLASATAVLASNLLDPSYRAFFHDPLWLVVAYVAFYAAVLWAFVRATSVAPWLAVAKAIGAYVFLAVCAAFPSTSLGDGAITRGLGGYLFLASFTAASRTWMAVTPGRYVYQLFDWGPGAAVGFIGFVFLGRGAWNTVNAFTLTRDRWMPLRARAPLAGRLVTAVPVAITVACVWGFLAVTRLERTTFSVEAAAVAQEVFDGLDCAALRAKRGTSTTDVRQRGDRRYEVLVAWGCPTTGVLVRTADDKVGTAAGPRPDCCTD